MFFYYIFTAGLIAIILTVIAIWWKWHIVLIILFGLLGVVWMTVGISDLVYYIKDPVAYEQENKLQQRKVNCIIEKFDSTYCYVIPDCPHDGCLYEEPKESIKAIPIERGPGDEPTIYKWYCRKCYTDYEFGLR